MNRCVAIRWLALSALLAAALSLHGPAFAHGGYGRVEPPRVLENVSVRLHDGRTMPLHDVLKGKVTAMQLVFTRCTSICPIQASMLVDLTEGEHLDDAVQVLSFSIDSDYDNPEAMRIWRKRYSTRDNWIVASSDFFGTLQVWDQLTRGPTGEPDPSLRVPQAGSDPNAQQHHSAQVFIIGPDAQLLWRSFDFPQTEELRQVLSDVMTSSQATH